MAITTSNDTLTATCFFITSYSQGFGPVVQAFPGSRPEAGGATTSDPNKLRSCCAEQRRFVQEQRTSECFRSGHRHTKGRPRIATARASQCCGATASRTPDALTICHNLAMCGRYRLSRRKQMIEEYLNSGVTRFRWGVIERFGAMYNGYSFNISTDTSVLRV
jgi:hypothetical protein